MKGAITAVNTAEPETSAPGELPPDAVALASIKSMKLITASFFIAIPKQARLLQTI